MLWEGESGGCVRPTMVQHEDVEAIREGLREGIDEELEHLGVQRWQLQEEPFPRRRLHRARDIAPLEDMLNRPHRLHPARGEAPAADGQEAKAAFILAEHAHRAGVRGRDDLLEACPTSRLERGKRLGVFVCDSGGPR